MHAAARSSSAVAPGHAPVYVTPGVVLDPESFRGLVALVDECCGIAMSGLKRTLLETRLRRRLQLNGLTSFQEYLAFLRTPHGRAAELQSFTDCVVTNQTSFFREQPHFDYLTAQELCRLAEGGEDRSLRIWSAAASSGQEAYSLAMIADEAAHGARPFPWSVTATDISLRMLRAVREGVYGTGDVAPVPARLRQRYVLPRRDGDDRVEMAPDLRRNLRIGQINLMHERYLPGQVMDIIFCRNVLIYFKPEVQLAVVAKLCRHLRPGGLLFLGHAESLRAPNLPLRLIRCNIHEKLEG